MSDVTIAYDVELRRPGCVLIQAALGCTISRDDLHRMDGWLLHPTPGLRVYHCTPEQVEQLVEVTNASQVEKRQEEA